MEGGHQRRQRIEMGGEPGLLKTPPANPSVRACRRRLPSARQAERLAYHCSMPGNHDLSFFQKILLVTDGTVTDLIALYAGEPIRVKKLGQAIREESAPAELQCTGPTRLLNRRILLSGATKTYLYAESQFVFERLSNSIQERMLNTDRPIGLLWKEERLETFREIVGQAVEPCAAIAQHFELPPSAPFVSRTYLIHHNGKPLGMITEKWPLSYFREQLS
jgi:chorismate-pyruvate lyase